MTNEYQGLLWKENGANDRDLENNRPISFLSSWENHVKSWTSIEWKKPKMIIKYEDLVYDKENVILKIIDFFEKNYNYKFDNKIEKISNIVESTSFNKLKNQESLKGFSEASVHSRFFSVGKMNQWLKALNEKQLILLENKFGNVMKKFDYKLSIEK